MEFFKPFFNQNSAYYHTEASSHECWFKAQGLFSLFVGYYIAVDVQKIKAVMGNGT